MECIKVRFWWHIFRLKYLTWWSWRKKTEKVSWLLILQGHLQQEKNGLGKFCQLGQPSRSTFKVWNFYFAQILTGIVEKKNYLTPFDFFFKFTHCLTLFPILLVHVNWILFNVTAHPYSKFYYKQILCRNESLTWINNSVEIWKMIIDKTGEVQQSIEDNPRNNCFKIPSTTCFTIHFL